MFGGSNRIELGKARGTKRSLICSGLIMTPNDFGSKNLYPKALDLMARLRRLTAHRNPSHQFSFMFQNG